MQFLKAQRESLWIGDQVHECLECMAALGYWKNMYDTKRDFFSVPFKWKLSLHTTNVVHHRDLFLIQFRCRRIPGGYFLSLEMLCFFSLLANFMTLKRRLYFVLHVSDKKQFCLWKVRGNLPGGPDTPVLLLCGLCSRLCAQGWWGLLLLWLLLPW